MADSMRVEWEEELFRDEASDVYVSETDSDDVQKFECKSTCQRAQRCPCKKEGCHCTPRCTCKSKAGPCKNRLTETVVHGGTGSSESTSRIVAEVQTNKERVKVLVQSLSSEQQQNLLVQLLQDRGGVELAKALLQRHDAEEGDNFQPPPSQGSPNWCRCGKCRHMDNPIEQLCCKNSTCITTTDVFYDICLNRHVLSVCIINRSDFFADDPEFNPASYRKAAYRQYIMYQHGYLGRAVRKVIPSCVVWKIRDHYPAPDNNYLGFKEY